MMLTSQLRAARALLGLSEEELSALSGIGTSTIKAVENGTAGYDEGIFHCLGRALEDKGIIFLSGCDGHDCGPGVRLKTADDHDEGIRPENLNSANDG